MQFIHSREYLAKYDVVSVDCDTQCNVRLTDDNNFDHFKRAQSHEYYGGFVRCFPCRIRPPHAGYWNITIDLAGGSATIRYGIHIIRGSNL